MANFPKPASVVLNTGHALYPDIFRFCNFGSTNRELITDTALTVTGAALVDDPDIGAAREFVAGAAITETLAVPQDCTILLVTAGRGVRTGTTASDCVFLCLNSSGNKIIFRYEYSSGGRYTIRYDGATGDVRNLSSNVFANDGAFDTGHAVAFHFADTEVMKSAINGVIGTATETTATGAALGSPPVAVPFFATFNSIIIGASANFPIAAIVVFDRLLSDAELESVTTDPWQILTQPPTMGDVTGDLGTDIVIDGEQDFTVLIQNIPSGELPVSARIGSTAGVGGTTLTGLTYATTANAGEFLCTLDMASGIVTGTTSEVHELSITTEA